MLRSILAWSFLLLKVLNTKFNFLNIKKTMQVIYLSWKLNLHHSWNVSILFKLLNVPKIWVTFHFLMDIWFFHFWQWTVCCCEYLCRNILNSLGNKSRNEIGCSNHNSLTFEGWSNFFTVAKLFSICISNVLKL